VGSPVVINETDIVNLVGATITASSTLTALLQSVKIDRIRIVDTAGGQILISWTGASLGAAGGSDLTFTAAGNAIFPSVIDMPPPPLSGAAFWIGASGSNSVMSISGEVDTTYVDLWITATLGGLTRQFTTNNSGNNNTVYYLPLDGPGATPTFPAIGMTPALN
jgi:hypothetical protein